MKKLIFLASLASLFNFYITTIIAEEFTGESIAISLVNNIFDEFNKEQISLVLPEVVQGDLLYNCFCANELFPGTCGKDNTILTWQPLNSSNLTTNTKYSWFKITDQQTPFYYLATNNTCKDAVVQTNLYAISKSGSNAIATVSLGLHNGSWSLVSIPTNLSDPEYTVTTAPARCSGYMPETSQCFTISVEKANKNRDFAQEQTAKQPMQTQQEEVVTKRKMLRR